MTAARKILKAVASVKLAVVILVALAVALAAGTIYESAYDTPTAQFYVYRANWFRMILAVLGVLIAAVMVDRWPWKRRMIPFLMAHIGILMMLLGSWLTDRHGLDGSLRVSEGETSAVVDIDQPVLSVMEKDKDKAWSVPVPWMPPEAKFQPFTLESRGVPMDLRVQSFITHADPVFEFLPKNAPSAEGARPTPAIQLKLSGGPMRVSQEFWLWAGAPGWTAFQAGPAWFGLESIMPPPPQGPRLLMRRDAKTGGISWDAWGSSGEKAHGRIASDIAPGTALPVPWKGGVQLKVLKFVADARLLTSYRPARVQYGQMAAPSALQLVAGNGEGAEASAWLGQGDRFQLRAGGRTYDVAYGNKRVLLPFSVRLDRFQIDYYEGSTRPAEYSSRVTVVDGRLPPDQQKSILISMNEPLEHAGITLYQSSYEDASPRPMTSIFSVNQDPGRPWKYWGSILIVLGTILLFAHKYWNARKQAPRK